MLTVVIIIIKIFISLCLGAILFLIAYKSSSIDILNDYNRFWLLIIAQISTYISLSSLNLSLGSKADEVAYLALLLFLIIQSITDIIEQRVKDYLIILNTLIILLIYIIYNSFNFKLLIYGFLSFSFVYLIFKLSKGRLGGADVKIFFPIGIVVGFIDSLNILFLASFSAVIYLLVLKTRGKDIRSYKVSFFPFIFIGSILNLYVNILI